MQTILHFVIFAKKMFFVMQIITFTQTILHLFKFAKKTKLVKTKWGFLTTYY